MKKFALFFSVSLWSVAAIAQDKIPSFGKCDKADLEMKDCSFDPGAEALVLLDVGEIHTLYVPNIGWQSEGNYRMRVKVLKPAAVHRAEVKIAFYSNNRMQEISGLDGISFNLDAAGNIEKSDLEKKAIYRKAINSQRSEVSFALPNVKVGTVFEYKYTITSRSYSYLPTWTFQKGIPVRYSAFNVILPQYFEFTTQVIKRQEMEKKDAGDDGTWYIMRTIPGLKDEPYSSGREDYLQRVEFQLSKINAPSYYEEIRTTWPKLINELLEDEDFGLAIKKNLRMPDDLKGQLASVNTTKDKVRTVYNFVQQYMQWNEEEGIYSSNGIKDAWDKKNASIADINFILIRLLRDADVDANPVLVRTKDNGAVNTVYPFLRQFNAVFVQVKDAEKTYIMNAADKFNPFYLIPYDVLYCRALLVDKNDGGIIQIQDDGKYMNNIFYHCNVDPDGKLIGEATLNNSGYSRNLRMRTLKKDQFKGLVEDNEGIQLKMDSFIVNNLNEDMKPLEQKVSFNGSMQSSGEYFFLPYNLFMGLEKNPFVEENRVMDIDFDFPKNYVITGSYTLPADYVVNELPKNTRMILPDTSIALTRLMQQDGNMISFRLTLDMNASGYSADSYPYIKEFFKKMYEILDERIVLKKK